MFNKSVEINGLLGKFCWPFDCLEQLMKADILISCLRNDADCGSLLSSFSPCFCLELASLLQVLSLLDPLLPQISVHHPVAMLVAVG